MPNRNSDFVLNESILKALLYSDIFSYPLSAKEVYQRLPTNHTTLRDVEEKLELLCQKGVVFKNEDTFGIQSTAQFFAARREGNRIASQMMPKAISRANLIYRFPFVRSVMISGSLSKNFADTKSDVDFFIVTRPGRLWITRTLLAFFQKVFLLNSRKYFCLNYFVDSEHLQIEEQNIFTATELATLIPVCGNDVYCQLLHSNSWLVDFFPNFKAAENNGAHHEPGKFKQRTEWIFSLPFFDGIERWLMKLTARHWKKLYQKKYPSAHFNIAFKATPYVSKSHPDFHQRRVTEAYQFKIESFFAKFQPEKYG